MPTLRVLSAFALMLAACNTDPEGKDVPLFGNAANIVGCGYYQSLRLVFTAEAVSCQGPESLDSWAFVELQGPLTGPVLAPTLDSAYGEMAYSLCHKAGCSPPDTLLSFTVTDTSASEIKGTYRKRLAGKTVGSGGFTLERCNTLICRAPAPREGYLRVTAGAAARSFAGPAGKVRPAKS